MHIREFQMEWTHNIQLEECTRAVVLQGNQYKVLIKEINGEDVCCYEQDPEIEEEDA